ncbi:hypothetical protein HZ326_29581 [Fusarium oxysporum f. sp. albedinis]|nr:hypothetical protein HZ326_29581 [Fusarium oxysporum f. sp. albedinis]
MGERERDDTHTGTMHSGHRNYRPACRSRQGQKQGSSSSSSSRGRLSHSVNPYGYLIGKPVKQPAATGSPGLCFLRLHRGSDKRSV